MDESLKGAVEAAIGRSITNASPVGGGCIGASYRIRADAEDFFLKTGSGEVAKTFEPEARGLEELSHADSIIRIPAPRAVQGEQHRQSFLVLEWIEEGHRGGSFWEHLGRGLAEIHQHTNKRYGFEEDNFIGRLPQQNGFRDSWVDFFWEKRLLPQINLARKKGRWQAKWDAPTEELHQSLNTLLPEHPGPSLLHGDLWGGNVMADSSGGPVLVDPATYYGHREADIAMTELFGGFDQLFYDAYREALPIDEGYEERRQIYNLYHLINHLNHFGASYAGQVGRILSRFS